MASGLLTAILLLGAVDGVGNLAGGVAARTAAHHTIRAPGEAALTCAHVARAAGIALGVDERKLEQAEGRRDQQHAQRHGTGIDGRAHGEHWRNWPYRTARGAAVTVRQWRHACVPASQEPATPGPRAACASL